MNGDGQHSAPSVIVACVFIIIGSTRLDFLQETNVIGAQRHSQSHAITCKDEFAN